MTFGVCQWCGGPVEGETSTGYVDDFCSYDCASDHEENQRVHEAESQEDQELLAKSAKSRLREWAGEQRTTWR